MDTLTVKKRDGNEVVDVRRGRGGHLVVRTENFFFFFLVTAEAIILATLMALNYFLRFDTSVRTDCDMFDYDSISLTCDPIKVNYEWSRLYFDYEVDESKPTEGLPLNYDMPEWVFFLCLFLIPIGIFCIVEGWYFWYPVRRSKEIITPGNIIIPQVVRRLSRITAGYLLGASVTGIIVCVMKFNIVSPRPHLMSVCLKLNTTSINDGWSVCDPQDRLWRPSQECHPDASDEEILEALKSHPSYHASLAIFAGVFTVAYCVKTIKVRGVYGVPLGLYMGIMVMAGIGATHRLASGHSFPKDIVVGSLLGTIVAIFVAKVTLYSFKEHIWKVKIVNPPQRKMSDKLLPIKELNGHIKSPPQVKEAVSDDEHEYSDSSDSSYVEEEYRKITPVVANIPRAHTAQTSNTQPAHAVNSNIASRNDRPGVTRSASVHNPHMENVKDDRLHSSLPRRQALWTTDASANPYSVPKQRVSTPFQQQIKQNDKSGYDGPYLSAYASKSRNEDAF